MTECSRTKHSVTEACTIICPDGFPLAATIYRSPVAKGVVILGCALGIKQEFYEQFALHLRDNNYHVISFDYRHTGRSTSKNHKAPMDMAEWGQKDIETVIQFAKDYNLPLYYIGHSIGGQVLGLAESASDLRKMIFVASSAPYWKRWSFPANLKILFTAKVILPLVASIKDPFPTVAMGLGNQNMPAPIVKQWAKWMSRPDYLLDKSFNLDRSGYNKLNQPILSYGFADDDIAPPRNVKKLMHYYPNANKTVKIVSPESINTSRIDHSGFYKDRFKESLWQETLDFLAD
ncbi:alpha/beta fold hydrolase [Parendozoicomonas haliclonae]|uniref:Alpha/beta hydrolase family protein n=1 Tax=Parendozoicomonas haliclonae TaxID=1960125 RepID=A0A1X7ALB5_9GAMM|nr:alpha/beta fold hydrolase [Parendozoicomonas haliclonae]SMA48233.1 Alpha/beta hydrolase family protein [Parendozoicomonas haliclonae]